MADKSNIPDILKPPKTKEERDQQARFALEVRAEIARLNKLIDLTEANAGELPMTEELAKALREYEQIRKAQRPQ